MISPSKKSQETSLGMIVGILLMLCGLIAGIAVLKIMSEGGFKNAEDQFCRFTNQRKSDVTLPIVEEYRPGVAVPKAPKFCMVKNYEIRADDWSSCDPQFRDLYQRDKLEGLRKCATQQVAQLIYRCWWMGLEGNGNPASWTCFTGQIAFKKPSLGIDQAREDQILNRIKEDIKKNLHCSPDSPPETDEEKKVFESGICLTLFNNWESIQEQLRWYLGYAALHEYNYEKILYGKDNQLGLKGCANEGVDATDLTTRIIGSIEVLLDQHLTPNQDGCGNIIEFVSGKAREIKQTMADADAAAKELAKQLGYDPTSDTGIAQANAIAEQAEQQVDAVVSEIAYGSGGQNGLRQCTSLTEDDLMSVAKLVGNAESSADIIKADIINEGISGCNVNGLKAFAMRYATDAKENKDLAQEKSDEITEKLKELLGDKWETVRTDPGPDRKLETTADNYEVKLIDDVSDGVFSAVSVLPDLGQITEADVREIIKSVNIPGEEDRLYSAVISTEDVDFLRGFSITPNSLFEIAYCDPPLPLGSGLGLRFTCGANCEYNPEKYTDHSGWGALEGLECSFDQKIQIGSGGSGAGGVTRGGSPYCDMGVFNLPILKDIRDDCGYATN